LKRKLNIALALTLTIIAVMQSRGQDLPMACVGSTERYWVKGFNGKSDFSWKITNEQGVVVPSTYYTLIGRGDTIEINWDKTLQGGIYTFEVVEHPDYVGTSCTQGDPYTQDIVLNSPEIKIPFDGVPTSVAVCFGEQAELDPGLFSSYLWQDQSTGRVFYTGVAGTYLVRLTNIAESCTYNEIEAKINPLPFIWLGNDTVVFGNQPIVLDASTNPDIMNWKWSTGSNQPSVTIENLAGGNVTVWVEVSDENSCKNSDTIKISGAEFDKLRIPQAFTPNGDGVNDKWYFPAPPLGTTIDQDLYPYFDEVNVRVFNRWGKLVWESNKKFIAWDGRDLKGSTLPMDSYHYLIRLTAQGKTYTYKGSITIVR
jgi:gliding motility-associated-like protein